MTDTVSDLPWITYRVHESETERGGLSADFDTADTLDEALAAADQRAGDFAAGAKAWEEFGLGLGDFQEQLRRVPGLGYQRILLHQKFGASR